MKFIAKFFQLIIFLIYNSKIPPTAIIGKGSRFVCKGIGVVLIPGITIGENCRIGPNFFSGRLMPYRDVPKIGDNVWLGANSVVIGPVIIENNVIISPGTFVNKSIKEGNVIGSTKAKIIKNVEDLDYNIFKNPKFKEGKAPYL